MPGMQIYNNIQSMNSQRALGSATARLGGTLEKLSTGLRVNKGGDDAAALAISEILRSDIRSFEQAVRNTGDAVSVVNIAEGSLSEQTGILTRMRELAIEASNFTFTSAQRTTVDGEFQQLKDEMDRISLVTNFNGRALLNGSMCSAAVALGIAGAPMVAQVDIDNNAQSQINLNNYIDITNMDVTGLGLSTTSVTTSDNAVSALAFIDTAIDYITARRGSLGAVTNRLENTISNLEVVIENNTAADSRLRDADMAKEMSKFTRDQILVQTGTSMLAQANQLPTSILKLIG
ncbi:MAG: flagellin FliC [Nitrospinae bacterium]|nr:flagellin FliC [Nitrospinota bacterium]